LKKYQKNGYSNEYPFVLKSAISRQEALERQVEVAYRLLLGAALHHREVEALRREAAVALHHREVEA
jgi:hypothetical protein